MLLGSIAAGFLMALVGIDGLDARYAETKRHQEWLERRERSTERAIAGIEARGDISETYSDNHQAQYAGLLLDDYVCNLTTPPRFDVVKRSIADGFVKVFDENNHIVGTLHPLNSYPSGRFDFHPVCGD